MPVLKIHRVMLDPGHGGTDAGNVNWGVREADSTLSLAAKTGHYIRLYSWNRQLQGSQIRTLSTRASDCCAGIDRRANLARENACSLMLSIHTDSSINPLAKGAGAFISARQDHRAESRKLAESIVAGLELVGFKHRGVKLDSSTRVGSLGVLRNTCGMMPAVLVECGFASNLPDRKIITSVSGKELVARAIAKAVVRFFGLDPEAGEAAYKQSTSPQGPFASRPAEGPLQSSIATGATSPRGAILGGAFLFVPGRSVNRFEWELP